MTLTQYLVWNGMTYRDFAELVGVDPVTVGNWARGKTKPARKMIPVIKEVTKDQVDIWTFFEDVRP